MGRVVRTFVLFLSLGVALLPRCYGQAAAVNGEITGTVSDATGAAVSGATVEITNTATGFKQSVKTGDGGLYRFSLLPLGTYDLAVQAAGFAAAKSAGIVLNAGATVTVDVPLQVAGTTTQVEVTAAAAITDPDRTSLGSTLDNNTVRNLPLVSRNPYNFILFQPNVSGRANTEFGVPRKINANGFNGRINYQIDGSNNTESDRGGIRLIPISDTYVEEVQTVSNGFAPEFGNTVGAVFNTITKSGGNDYHGDAAYFFRRTDFNARPKLLAATTPTPEIDVNAYSADGGGRLVRDKVFFFGAFEHVKRDLPGVVAVPAATIAQLGLPADFANAIPFSQSVYFYMAKADWSINSRNRLSVRYLHHANDSPFNNGTIGGLNLVSQSYNFIDRSHVGGVQLVSTVSDHAINELRGQVAYRGQEQDRFSASGTGPTIVVSGVANFGGPTGAGFVYQETTPEIADNFSYNSGAHALKVGFSTHAVRDTQTAATAATYTFPTIAAYLAAVNGATPKGYSSYSQTFGNPSISYNSLFTGFFAQDTWKPLRNLTLTYGLRYDLYQVPNADKNSLFSFSQSFRTDNNNVGPRLGLAYGLGHDQKTVIRASTGIFYDPPQTDQYRLALLNNGSPAFFNITATPSSSFAPAFPAVFTALPTGFSLATQNITTVAPDFATLYSYNATVSVTRELSSNFVVSASYLHTAGNRLPVYSNINLVPSGAFLADGRPIFSTTARVFPGFANILAVQSVGHSNYNGANITLNKRLSKGYEFYATYTWSHAIDDAPEQNNIDSGNFLLSDPSNRARDRANSLTDKRHTFNMTGVFMPEFSGKGAAHYLVNHNRLSIGLVAASGDLFNIGSNQILNGDPTEGTAFQRPLFIGRNTVRAPAVFELNARYSRLFQVGEKRSFEFLAESTNLTNTLNVISLNTTAKVDATGAILTPSPNAATGGRDQRLIQMGLRFNF
ncbi:MAG: TonB-dependent receptor [Acidobacteriia bacterium]|nr:TonB-dependent receptor [Terriglobia bacterium]